MIIVQKAEPFYGGVIRRDCAGRQSNTQVEVGGPSRRLFALPLYRTYRFQPFSVHTGLFLPNAAFPGA